MFWSTPGVETDQGGISPMLRKITTDIGRMMNDNCNDNNKNDDNHTTLSSMTA